MYQVLAWKDLRDPQVGGALDAEGVLEVARQAGFSENEAQKAATRHGFERLKRNYPV